MTALLITATIAPAADTANHTQFNPDERLAQYEHALRFYMSEKGSLQKILFVENSAYPLDTLRSAAAETARPDRSVHFHSFKSEIPAAWGKGHGEINLIERAFAHFRDILDDKEPVWKITGRLIVKNIGQMIATQPADFRVYVDLRDVPFVGEAFGGNQWADTRLIAFTPEGYRTHIQQVWPNKRFCLEKRVFQTLKPQLGSGSGIVPRFLKQPRFLGVSGGSGKNYTSPLSHAKTGVRASVRTLTPWLWL